MPTNASTTPASQPPRNPSSSSLTRPATTAKEADKIADKLGGLASAVLQIPAAVHHRTAGAAAHAASRDAALHRERALARLHGAVHHALPAALQDFDRELDVALERAEAVQRCLSALEGAQARAEQRKKEERREL